MPGYKIPAGVAIDKGWQCVHCKLLLREARQTDDGDRLCLSCCEEIKRMDNHKCDDCGIVVSPETEVFPDRAVRKLILALVVSCEHRDYGCPWEGRLEDWETHCSKCMYQPATCPNEGCGVQLPLSQLDQHIDGCPHRLVVCQYCNDNVAAGQLEEHSKTCPQFPVQCPFCHKESQKSQLQAHFQDGCTLQGCTYCGELVDRETTNIIKVADESQKSAVAAALSGAAGPLPASVQWTTSRQPHLANPKHIHKHFQALAFDISTTKANWKSLSETMEQLHADMGHGSSVSTELAEAKAEHEHFVRRLVNIEGQIEALRQNGGGERREVKLKTLENLQYKLNEFSAIVSSQGVVLSQKEREIQELKRTVESLSRSSRDNTQAISQLQSTKAPPTAEPHREKGGYYDPGTVATERSSALEKKVEDLERQTSLLKVHVSELELQLQASLASTHTGSFLWRIPDVSRRRRDAIEERITSIYSPPFYTGRNGYKMCIRAYLNGDGTGYKTHLSLFFVLMKGEYDPLLKWPFDNKVSLILVDQNHRKHVVQTFKPSAESSSFQQPTTDMNVASGCPQFAKLSALDDTSYVKVDVMYIKCIVDTSKIFHP